MKVGKNESLISSYFFFLPLFTKLILSQIPLAIVHPRYTVMRGVLYFKSLFVGTALCLFFYFDVALIVPF